MFRLCSLLLAGALAALPAAAETLSGPIRVIDADTIDIGAAANIRLVGIDAAEGEQTCRDGAEILPCGRIATDAARALYQGLTARCSTEGRDRFDRYLARCRVGGVEMNAELVRLGLARVYRDDPTYFEEQKEAVLMERGLWRYDMQDPAAFRAEARATRAGDAPSATGTCAIKGNISGNGRIYHMPGQEFYDRTRINPARGERMFCTEGEARAAGWRRAQR
ncbi:thermonuclease family protein [uncultured Jannaschia sp.]|uniref:thermonuclease family protein n=1 Tax=uncultured Jannaschia sp. TaxID=293347 RepID=UPI002616C121|nr:thermonuclease family protein [uncultured Jannaschia sp.]